MGIEYELKFQATDPQQAAIRQAFSGEEHRTEMQTTYYDTPSGVLTAQRYTLRRRLENGVSICTLKTSAQEDGRGEWDIPCDTIEQALPTLCRLSGSALMPPAKQLIPVCGARFTRITKLLILPDFTAELALDKGILTGGERQAPLQEVELELKSGSREALDAFGKQLQQRFGLKEEPKSKFRRAFALAKGEKDGTV